MTALTLAILLFFIDPASANENELQIRTTRCVFVAPQGANIPFQIVKADPGDKEYRTIERFKKGTRPLDI